MSTFLTPESLSPLLSLAQEGVTRPFISLSRTLGQLASLWLSPPRPPSELEEEEEFIRLLQTLRGQLEVKDRVTNRMPLFKCFVGKELVDYLGEAWVMRMINRVTG